MRSNFDDVGDFHEKFGLDNVTHSGVGPRDVPPDLLEFRRKFLREELDEFEEAVTAGDRVGMFDALIDLVVVAMGTAHLMGFPWQRGWNEVHRANMSKIRARVDGSDSKRGSGWDVIKPPGWKPPDLEAILDIPSHVCPQCQRKLNDIQLKEVIVDRMGTQWISVHCICGCRLTERPA